MTNLYESSGHQEYSKESLDGGGWVPLNNKCTIVAYELMVVFYIHMFWGETFIL